MSSKELCAEGRPFFYIGLENCKPQSYINRFHKKKNSLHVNELYL